MAALRHQRIVTYVVSDPLPPFVAIADTYGGLHFDIRASRGAFRPLFFKKNQRTLDRVIEKPERSDIPWRDIEKLIIALGGEISEGRGSRVRVYLNGVRAVFHRPHPERVMDKGAVSSVRRFLKEAEVIS